jgi:DNA polymerase III alpha subunit
VAPDINHSRADFSMSDARILFGLAAIKNVGQHAVESIVTIREADGPFKSLEDLCERTSAVQDVNRRVLEALVQSGTCDTLGERGWLLATLEHLISRAEQARKDREAGQINMLDLLGSAEGEKHDFGLALDVKPMSGEDKLKLEKELLGLYLSDHPLRRIAAELAKLSDTQAVEVTSALQDTEVRIAGLVREVRRVVTRKGQIKARSTRGRAAHARRDRVERRRSILSWSPRSRRLQSWLRWRGFGTTPTAFRLRAGSWSTSASQVVTRAWPSDSRLCWPGIPDRTRLCFTWSLGAAK